MLFVRIPRSVATEASPKTRRRARRWIASAALAGAGGLLLLVAALFLMLRSLDRPWIKSRIVRLAKTAAGVDVDYASARIDLASGATVDGLVVRSPAAVRSFAPELARVGHVEAQWSLGSLLRGNGPKVARVRASDVVVSVVADENGKTSFDLLGSPAQATPTPSAPVPLSKQAASLLGSAPPVANVAIDRISLVYVQTGGGEVVSRTTLDGLGLDLVATPDTRGTGWQVQVDVGSKASPRHLHLAREGARGGAADAETWFAADVAPTDATMAFDLRMLDQSFVGRLSADHWLHAEARARFDAAAKKTSVTIDHTEAGDGALSLDADLEVPDAGDPALSRAHAEIDVARLLHWLPSGLVPIAAERAHVRADAQSLILGSSAPLAPGGSASLDAEFAHVSGDLSGAKVNVEGGTLSFHVRPEEGGAMSAKGTVAFPGAVRVGDAGGEFAAQGVELTVDGRRESQGALSGRGELRFARVSQTGSHAVDVGDGKVELAAAGLTIPEDVQASRGEVTLAVTAATMNAALPGARAEVGDLSLHAHTVARGGAPYGGEVDASVSRLVVQRGAPSTFGPIRLSTRLTDVVPVPADPAASSGATHTTLEFGGGKVTLDATKKKHAVDFALDANAPSLAVVRPFLSGAPATAVRWNELGVILHSKGHIDRVAGSDPFLRQTTDLHLARPSFGELSAKTADVTLSSKGDLREHALDADLRAAGLVVAGTSPMDDHVVLGAKVDRGRPSIELTLTTEGHAKTKLAASASYDREKRAVSYDVKGDVAGLDRLAPLVANVEALRGFDLSELGAGLAARGVLSGVVDAVAPNGKVTFAPDPIRTMHVTGSTDVRVTHFRYSKGDFAVATPALTVHADTSGDASTRTADTKVECGSVHLDIGENDVDLKGIVAHTRAVFDGNLLEPQIDLTHELSVQGVTQDILPEYPLGDVSLAVSAVRNRGGLVHVSDLKLSNGAAGTSIALTGNVDLSEGRRTLSITTDVKQDLDRLSTVPDRFKGSGRVGAEATVTSPDLSHFRVRAAVKGAGVSLHLPRQGVDVEEANGEVPIALAVVIGAKGVALERTEKVSPYSMLRFADQHPLLARSGFLSVGTLKTPTVTIAPLVGNLEIEENVVSLRQFEMGVRGGRITGQCAVDWEGPKSTLELHVRASGVQSSHGEPFDGNIAVAISAGDRTIEGRAEILRIGERHLLDLLDLQDPLHVDPAMNRIRTALVFGYPDHLRLVFDHGFASAHLELGGLARLISIGELRGIPMGPIIDKVLAPVLDKLDTKGTP